MPPRGHSRFAPSAAERWLNCPGSVALAATCPVPKTSVHAAEGTVAHGLAEAMVLKKLSFEEVAKSVGKVVVGQDGHDIEITDEMVEAAQTYADIVHHDIRTLEMLHPVVYHYAEKAVVASSISPELRGTSDYIVLVPGERLIIYDFKYGKGVKVDVEENVQLSIYALAALDTILGAQDVKEVELVIVQPRAGAEEKRWSCAINDLRAFGKEVSAGLKEAEGKDARLEPGKWCRWCPASAKCTALYAKVQEEAMADFSVVPMPAAPMSLPPAKSLSEQQISRALAWEETFVTWFAGLREYVKAEKESSRDAFPDWKLVEGRSNRKWISEEEVLRAFGPIVGEEALYKKKMLSPAEVEKLVGKKNPDMARLTTRPPGAVTLVPAGDKREEVVPEQRRLEDARRDFSQAPIVIPAATEDPLMVEFREGMIAGQKEKSNSKSVWPQ